MPIDESSEENALGLPLGGDSQQILILSEKHSMEGGSSVQQRFIV